MDGSRLVCCGLESYTSWQGQVVGFCEHSNEAQEKSTTSWVPIGLLRRILLYVVCWMNQIVIQYSYKIPYGHAVLYVQSKDNLLQQSDILHWKFSILSYSGYAFFCYTQFYCSLPPSPVLILTTHLPTILIRGEQMPGTRSPWQLKVSWVVSNMWVVSMELVIYHSNDV
jgi:hypothetical protein